MNNEVAMKAIENFFDLKEIAYYCPFRDRIYQVSEGPYIYILDFEGYPVLTSKERFEEVFGKNWIRLGEI